MKTKTSSPFKIGDVVSTSKGGRFSYEGPFKGTVVGFSEWAGKPAAQVRKSSGQIVQCIQKNLTLISSAKSRRGRSRYYMSLDTETGGLDCNRYPILSIGFCITTSSLRIVEEGEIFIKARLGSCDPKALEVNGINLREHNKNAVPKSRAVFLLKQVIYKYWPDQVVYLIGQNVPFDVGFVSKLFESQYQKFKYFYKTVDLMSLWWTLQLLGRVNTKKGNQHEQLRYLDVKARGREHTALEDARNVVRILRKLKKELPRI